ncbi:hypothetical protein [Alicycliphilus denitrificans]|uniref:Uncharacterized protein n=1 Tax=Alicycliphilus denitrificans TaxID=179636 RepID=A0A3R7HTM6_9BURK|nr:hypothetical protein [Alicycliphilus denitrificans]RKJ94539.1 hypothetical protein CE154_019690 [Alicycliphilus denitrificans]
MPVTRTPPEQKWLLNERAVVVGELEAIESELDRLAARKKHLTHLLAALDNVYSQVAPSVPPGPAFIVQGHTRYGGRGNCIKWAREVLRAAYPSALDTAALTLAAEEAFGLVHTTPEQRGKFRNNSLRTALRTLLAQGEAERLHDYRGVPHRAGVWRWVPQEPSYAAIAAQAKENQERPWP